MGMIVNYIIIAAFIAWIWIDYFRMIDIFEKEKLKYLIATFLLGGTSVLIVLGLIEFLYPSINFYLNGNFINDFLFCFLHIGVPEEFAKLIPFLIIYILFKKEFNEPIDFLIFMSIAALGFSAVENVMYMHRSGPGLITGRAILSSVGHMFDSALIAYGIILYKYRNKSFFIIILFFFLGALSHGFYDFWLIYDRIPGGWLITILYFLITISIYATILNNALNNSEYFTYKKSIYPNKIAFRLLLYYSILYVASIILMTIRYNIFDALTVTLGSLNTVGVITFVAVLRLSRFKLIKGHWFKVKIELPFSVSKNDPLGIYKNYFKVGIKGDSYNDVYMSRYYQDSFFLKPLTQRKTYLEEPRIAFIEEKIFINFRHGFYLTKVYIENIDGEFEWMLIKPKEKGKTMYKGKLPIVGILFIDQDIDINHISEIDFSKLNAQFLEWCVVIDNDK